MDNIAQNVGGVKSDLHAFYWNAAQAGFAFHSIQAGWNWPPLKGWKAEPYSFSKHTQHCLLYTSPSPRD